MQCLAPNLHFHTWRVRTLIILAEPLFGNTACDRGQGFDACAQCLLFKGLENLLAQNLVNQTELICNQKSSWVAKAEKREICGHGEQENWRNHCVAVKQGQQLRAADSGCEPFSVVDIKDVFVDEALASERGIESQRSDVRTVGR